MPLRGRSGALRAEPLFGVSGLRPPAAIALYTRDEIVFAMFLGGFIGCVITVALAFLWSLVL